ncbi:hypothetical protein NHX12_026684 [Muraenolepis orangiensis]|uniref:UBR-type domain-containing protein n=1 Tax=Muraenolepis orangiensis TaxID=630683 RepID=A0A9Q0EJY9_9TELE|nr:hypothetical protein NHX12_026684 [Muraenolepis orangiensis]
MWQEDEEENTVSLVDVMQEDEELQNEASAVLAGSDSDLCSYPQGGEAAGVCLACSYKCHEGHDLFELYTKRNFRCDCGNGKFKQQCKLYPDKEKLNSQNKYSQNFFGLYCTCQRPYPDPEDQVEDEMVQCIMCEDWLHGRHLGCISPDSVELHEMKGAVCCKRPCEEVCRLKELQEASVVTSQTGAVFWPASWRSKLCSCVSCQRRYLASGVSFLLDKGDTVLAYETKGQQRYNDMKTELKDFLQSFAVEGKVVTPDDIRRFFEQQQSRKRRRIDDRQIF